ncbi:hypothetical protein LOTGIDRAFT_168337 [Lottia gigantea]|uniref:Uncharacterized protein n=1 Tax=Lottia gigantea TaxID=225164 RepID=V3Z2P3_LOTGI|nr:hypothetical protein LOTGIDRAFT_168337 [Lottia gigantea]ESO84848.1 hypothetical protein LOTGIDRAFT_168337 [Lottia gigantea]
MDKCCRFQPIRSFISQLRGCNVQIEIHDILVERLIIFISIKMKHVVPWLIHITFFYHDFCPGQEFPDVPWQHISVTHNLAGRIVSLKVLKHDQHKTVDIGTFMTLGPDIP